MSSCEVTTCETALVATSGPDRAARSLLTFFNPVVRLFEAARSGSWKMMMQSTLGRMPEPAFALEVSESAYMLRAFLPGATRKGLACTVEDRELRIRATSEVRFTDGRSFSYIRQTPVDERYALPADADAAKVRWELIDSVLYAAIPRRREILAAMAQEA